MFTLIATGTLAAWTFSMVALLAPRAVGTTDLYFEAAAVIIALVLAGQVLELRARRRTGDALRALMDLAPAVAWKIDNNGAAAEVPLFEISPGDLLRFVKNRLEKGRTPRVLLYAHGGLVSERAAIQRTSEYLERFLEQDIYPLSFLWKTDAWTTLSNLLADAFKSRRAEGLLDAAKDIQRAFARSVSRSVMGARGRTDVDTTYDSSVDEQVGQVLPNDPGWHLLEYGTASQPPTRQIMHAVEAAGYTFVDGGR
jgi:hypothetical protein